MAANEEKQKHTIIREFIDNSQLPNAQQIIDIHGAYLLRLPREMDTLFGIKHCIAISDLQACYVSKKVAEYMLDNHGLHWGNHTDKSEIGEILWKTTSRGVSTSETKQISGAEVEARYELYTDKRGIAILEQMLGTPAYILGFKKGEVGSSVYSYLFQSLGIYYSSVEPIRVRNKNRKVFLQTLESHTCQNDSL